MLTKVQESGKTREQLRCRTVLSNTETLFRRAERDDARVTVRGRRREHFSVTRNSIHSKPSDGSRGKGGKGEKSWNGCKFDWWVEKPGEKKEVDEVGRKTRS